MALFIMFIYRETVFNCKAVFRCLPIFLVEFQMGRVNNLKFNVFTGLRYLSIMRQAMFIEGRKVLGSGVDALDLKSGIYMALDAINKHLKCRARMVNTFEEIFQVYFTGFT